MGIYVSIRGWIEANAEQLPLIRAVIENDEDGVGHLADSWYFPTTGGGYSRFVYFGCTVRESEVPRIRAQIHRISETIKTHDGCDTDCPQGDFLVEHEFHEAQPDRCPLTRWRFSRGVFVESCESDI